MSTTSGLPGREDKPMVPVAYIPVGVTITMLVKLTEAITASYPDAYLSGEGVPEGMLFKVVLEHDTDT